ncbi:peptidase [Geomonas sp. Red276]
MEQMARQADAVEALLKEKGVTGYEIVAVNSRDLNLEAKEGRLDTFRFAEPSGVAVRVLDGDGLGFSFSTAMDRPALERMVEGALVAARLQSSDPCHGFPIPAARYPEVPGLFDPQLSAVSEEEKIERVLELERLVLSRDPRLKRVRKCSYSDSRYETLIRNSHGLEAFYRGSQVSASVSVIAEEGGAAQMGWDFDYANRYDGLDLATLADRAARKATSLLGAGTLPTMRCPAVLDNRVAADLLDVLSSSFLAENVHKGKSLLAGRVGERLFSDRITIRDEGLRPGGMGTAPCDGEGVPQQNTLLVDQGVVKGFLFDTYWGKRMGAASTGNSSRGGIKAPPRMGAHNLFIEPGSGGAEELLAGIGRGVLITDVMGIHTANPISGDFSVGASGFYLENGEIVRPVKGIAIAGNLLEIFRGVDRVAGDLRFFGSSGAPSLRLAELDVSGS